MARGFFMGNGAVTATGDRCGALRECYAPSISPETQLLRRPARCGLAVDGILRWFTEEIDSRPGDPADAPLAAITLLAPEHSLELWIESFVDCRLPILVRRVQVTNRGDVHRALSLYFHHDFRLAGGRPHESARRDSESGGLLHTSGRHAILFNLDGPGGVGVPLARTVSRASESDPGADAEALDGRAHPKPEAAGFADSVGGLALSLPPGGSILVTGWLSFGGTPEEARSLDARFRRDGISASLTRTRGHWNLWSSEGALEFADLPDAVGAIYGTSLLALRLHQTPEGAIVSGVEENLAAREPRWCWLADAALAADALGRAGYRGAARRYFSFVAAAAGRAGRLAPAFEPSGEAVTVAGDAESSLLGTALHVWAAARYFERDRDVEFLATMWERLLAPAADRLAGSLDPRLGLPRSTDWWNERSGVHAPVAGAVRGALRGAARLAATLGEASRARGWMAAADTIARAMTSRMIPPSAGRFSRSLLPEGDGWRLDATSDASLLTIGLFDDFEPEDPRVKATVAAMKERLWVHTGTGGMARYEGDRVGSVGGGTGTSGEAAGEMPRSPNVAPTLWLALHAIRAARRLQDLEPARTLLFWAASRAEGVGLLPERLHPYRGRTTGPAPSLLAHAWFVQGAVEYAERVRLLTRCERCGEPAPSRRSRRAAGNARGDVGPLPAPSLPGIVADL